MLNDVLRQSDVSYLGVGLKIRMSLTRYHLMAVPHMLEKITVIFLPFKASGVLAWNSGAGSLSGSTHVTPFWDSDTPQSPLCFLFSMTLQVSALMASGRKPCSVMLYPRRWGIVPCAICSRTSLSMCKTESLCRTAEIAATL